MVLNHKDKGVPFMQHWVAQMYGVEAELLDSEELCKSKLVSVTENLNLTIWATFAYKFDLGISAFVVIAESHVALHTWPEYGYAHVDIITCSEKSDFEAFMQSLQNEFIPSHIEVSALSYLSR